MDPSKWSPADQIVRTCANHRVRFCLLFGVCMGVLMVLFLNNQAHFKTLYLWPITWMAGSIIGLWNPVVSTHNPLGNNDLSIIEIGRYIFHVKHECSGISAFFIYLAAVMAYPVGGKSKLLGVVVGMPAFFLYGVLRLVLLGAIALFTPELLRFFHLYYMVILNLGFVMLMWSKWVNSVEQGLHPEGAR
jgi:exosortase/archaeosortase family protein